MPIVLLYAWLGLGGTLAKFAVPVNDAALVPVSDGMTYHARPFTGLVYESGDNGLPVKVKLFWRGHEPGRLPPPPRKPASYAKSAAR